MPRLSQPTAKKVPFENTSGKELFETKEQIVNKEEEVEVEVKDEPKDEQEEKVVVTKAEPKEEDDATLRLKKQIEDLKKSEELQRNAAAEANRQREEAIRRYQEEARRVAEFQKQSEDHEEVAIGAALAAAKAESDKAQSDLTAALNAGDHAAAGEAQRRLARAEARFVSLESGKSEIEERKKAPKPEPETSRQVPTGDPVDQFDLPPAEKQWLRDHRDFLTDRKKWNAMQYVSQNLALDGIRPGMSEFLPKYEEGLRQQGVLPALEEDIEGDIEPEERPIRERRIVSAPVSRETSSAGKRNGKVTLTPQEREMARLSGITETEYARQKQKLRELQDTGAEEYTWSRYDRRDR